MHTIIIRLIDQPEACHFCLMFQIPSPRLVIATLMNNHRYQDYRLISCTELCRTGLGGHARAASANVGTDRIGLSIQGCATIRPYFGGGVKEGHPLCFALVTDKIAVHQAPSFPLMLIILIAPIHTSRSGHLDHRHSARHRVAPAAAASAGWLADVIIPEEANDGA